MIASSPVNNPLPLPAVFLKRDAMKPLALYTLLSKRTGPKSYIGNIMMIAFVGTHVPLLTLLVHFILTSSLSVSIASRALLIALAATLIGTGVTLWALHSLLVPIRMVCEALRQYLNAGHLPQLPMEHTDEAGILMADTQRTVEHLDEVIHNLANYDALTGLPNRTLFLDRLSEIQQQAQPQGKSLAVLVMDVSSVKSVNDLFGRTAGDLLLKGIADRLHKHIRENNLLSRIGGNRFALVQTIPASQDAVAFIEARAQKLRAIVSAQPFVIEGLSTAVPSALTIGITVLSPRYDVSVGLENKTPENLLQEAEAAVDQFKDSTATEIGGEPIGFYSAEMSEQLRQRLALEADLRCALERNEMEVVYQPQVDNTSHRIAAVEALLRWRHPVRGSVSPSEFIPIAEANGMIVDLGEWVLETACAQNKAWQKAGLAPVRMGVNLSPRQFKQPDLVEKVTQILRNTGLSSQWLEIEVTESLAMENAEESIAILRRLRDLGVTLSLDDFGTGYSSLNQLRRLPIDALKIDRSFVQNVTGDDSDAIVTEAIIALAHSLKIEVIAEGVETIEQLDFVTERGCDRSQGYYFAQPTAAELFPALLQEQTKGTVSVLAA
jgi:diguanylate cyclase (GGDEF)-like protein